MALDESHISIYNMEESPYGRRVVEYLDDFDQLHL